MARNIILFLATAAALALVFIGFLVIFRVPPPAGVPSARTSVELRATEEASADRQIHVDTPQGQLEIPPGEEMAITQYDRMGRPMDYYRWKSWEKVPDSANRISVTEPEIILRLNTGMIVRVTAAKGELSTERLDSKHYRPKSGSLSGEARITIDRETEYERAPLETRPQDAVAITMEQLEFDLELGELRSDGPLRVEAAEFTATGRGLHLIWNQEENRVEKLAIERGEQLVFRGDFLEALSPKAESEQPQPATAPPQSAAQPTDHEPIAYRCVFSGEITIEHQIEGQRRASLSAEELDLLLDLSGGGARAAQGGSRPEGEQETGADSKPQTGAATPSQEVIVRWSGPLLIRPASAPSAGEAGRKRVAARGNPIRVELPDGRVACNRLELHEESKRLWLFPTDGGYVEFSSGSDIFVRAAEVFVELARERIKLVGEVVFQANREAADGRSRLTIQADSWADLFLGARRSEPSYAADIFSSPLAAQTLDSAVFVGNVRVKYENQRLHAHQLKAEFDAPAKRTGNEASAPDPRGMLKAVTAIGDVRLLTSSTRSPWWLPPNYDRSLSSGSLRLEFVERERRLEIREMYASGMMEIHDRPNELDARGHELRAFFSVAGENSPGGGEGRAREELEYAEVVGTEEQPGALRVREYDLRGKRIVVDNRSERLRVEGRSELTLNTGRGLQGFARAEGAPIRISSTRSLEIDGKTNTAVFAGEVSAGTDSERLVGDTMTLYLEDVQVGDEATRKSRSVARMIEPLGAMLGFKTPRGRLPGLRDSTADERRTRKDLSRILATDAGLVSETFSSEGGLPLVHQSIAAPRIEIDAQRRYVRTFGLSTMLMTDLRMKSQAGGGDDGDVNVVSSLVGGGPSQTAVSAKGGMLYMLGEAGPARRDSLLLEGGVRFRRVTGSEMAELPALLPDVARDPETLKKLPSANTYLECDRLEGLFLIPDSGATTSLGVRASVNIEMLNAARDVYFRDQRGDNLREIYAHQLEYIRQDNVFRILGDSGSSVPARIYESNEKSGRFNAPVQAPALILRLDTGAIEAKELRGRIGD